MFKKKLISKDNIEEKKRQSGKAWFNRVYEEFKMTSNNTCT